MAERGERDEKPSSRRNRNRKETKSLLAPPQKVVQAGREISSWSSAGARVLYVGGNANNGGNDGPGYVNANNALSNSNANIGCRLAEKS